MTTTIDVNEAPQLSALVALAKAGHAVIIAEGNTPIARLTAIVPAASAQPSRVAGLHHGVAWVSDDFDQPLPDEFWLGKA